METRPGVEFVQSGNDFTVKQVLYETRKTVFDHISKHREESCKYDAQRSIFDELRGV